MIAAETSLALLDRAQGGDQHALAELIQRYLPRLERWATGRLPPAARGLLDTADVVQETMVNTVRNLPRLNLNDDGALPAYLRRALANRLADAYRRSRPLAAGQEMPSDIPAPGPSPYESAVGTEAARRYEAGLQRLSPKDREFIELRIELCYGYDEIAKMTDRGSAASARVAVSRALVRLAKEMQHGG